MERYGYGIAGVSWPGKSCLSVRRQQPGSNRARGLWRRRREPKGPGSRLRTIPGGGDEKAGGGGEAGGGGGWLAPLGLAALACAERATPPPAVCRYSPQGDIST